MKKISILILAVIMLTGCSSKTVRFDALGQKSVTTKTDDAAYSEAQAQAMAEYYKAIANPPVIATITQPDGSIVSINSQVPPPAPVVRQYENQYIRPVSDVIKNGLGWYFGYRIAGEVMSGMGDTHINNTGDGQVTYDRSDSVNVETNHAEENSTLNQGSHNDGSDRSVTDSHDSTATPTVVPAPDPVIVPAPDPVIVQPSYPPASEDGP